MTLPHGVGIEYVILYGMGILIAVGIPILMGLLYTDITSSYNEDPSVRDVARSTLVVIGVSIGTILAILVVGYIAAFIEQVYLV